jgi:phospholipase C
MDASEGGLTRRRFVGTAATAVGAAALGRPAWAARGGSHGARAPFDHVVVAMMENRSFDHFLGWLRRADGRQAGLTYTDEAGVEHETHPLAPDFQGCGHPDPDHSYLGGRVEYNGGRCDGWLRADDNDEYAIGYYRRKDLAFLGRAVPRWTTFSRYFSSILGPTFPNRFYQHSGQTDRLRNTFTISTLPTIWDRLADAGLSGRYYYGDVPFLALWGDKYLSMARPALQFLADCAQGTLPNVSFVDPRFAGEAAGTSGDDHPHADIRNGQVFMSDIYRAVTTSPQWDRTVLIFNYDEWGGFFDHVPPPAGPIPPADQLVGNEDGLLGFRVPALLVSPFARRNHVSRRTYEHTSILRMIESRWSLEPLTVRDATANDLSRELRADGRRHAPQFDVPRGPFGGACPVTPAEPAVAAAAASVSRAGDRHSDREAWAGLREVARDAGWPV